MTHENQENSEKELDITPDTEVRSESLDESEKTEKSDNKKSMGKDEKKNGAESEEIKPEEPIEMVEIPKDRLTELENAEAVALENVKRERAEAINYRKRLQKQRDEFAEYASANVLAKVLNIQDDLTRIIENGVDTIPKEHMEGIRLLDQRMKGLFESEGVKLLKIEEGKTRYDPNLHEAVVAQPIPGVPPNTIVQVLSAGFMKGDRTIRPAKVIVAKAPVEEKKEEPKQEDQSKSAVDPQENKAAE